jgi:hypothetical protein
MFKAPEDGSDATADGTKKSFLIQNGKPSKAAAPPPPAEGEAPAEGAEGEAPAEGAEGEAPAEGEAAPTEEAPAEGE